MFFFLRERICCSLLLILFDFSLPFLVRVYAHILALFNYTENSNMYEKTYIINQICVVFFFTRLT